MASNVSMSMDLPLDLACVKPQRACVCTGWLNDRGSDLASGKDVEKGYNDGFVCALKWRYLLSNEAK